MKLKSLFFGTPEFAVPSFQTLIEQTECLGVVSQPDRPRGRGHKVLPCETRAHAQKLGLANFAPESLRKDSEELQRLRSFLAENPVDIFIVLAYGNLLPDEFLNGARLGCFNIHGSLLPRWRGAAPIQRALEAGDSESGVCIQRMVKKLDAGDVLIEEPIPVGPNENAIELTERLSALSANILAKFLVGVSSASLDMTGQTQDESLVTYAAKITKEEVIFQPEWTAHETHNKIRAFRAWPQVKFRTREGIEIKLLKSLPQKISPELQLNAGEVKLFNDRVYLGCSVRAGEEFVLEILEAQSPNKAPQNAREVFKQF